MLDLIKRYRWPLIMMIAGALCYRLFFYSGGQQKDKAAANVLERFPYPTNRLSESHSDYILADAQVGRIDLAIELIKLRRDCAGEVADVEACNERIRQLILGLPGKDKQKLVELFDQYLQFEGKMRQSLPANFAQLTNAEKYKLMKKARRDFFGEDTAKLIFGVEEARIALQEEQQKFNSPEYVNLPPDERMRLFEERKKEILGPYYQTMIEREPADIKYGTEMMLHQTELAKMSESDRAKAMTDLRTKYFGEAQAQRMADDEKRQNQALTESVGKMDQFLAAESDYVKNNPSLTDEQRRAGIEDLRKKILGK